MDLADLILLVAIPWFIGMMLLEHAVDRAGRKQEERLQGPLGYERVDTRTSISMGLGSLVVNSLWRLVEVAALTAVATLAPWDLGHGWVAWVVAMVGVDFVYYWDHRLGHEVRLIPPAYVKMP